MKNYINHTFLLFVLSLINLSPAVACSCSYDNRPIDSTVVEPYEFIALVKITADVDHPAPPKNGIGTTGLLSFQIKELFKGQPIHQLLEEMKNTSCDLGISIDEEWLVFGKKRDGIVVITSCDRNARYRKTNGFREWQFESGIKELRQLRKLYNHPKPVFSNEVNKEFYPEGKLELQEAYMRGKLNGERKVWYPNGQLYGSQLYKNDTLTGKEVWYYPSGQLHRELFHANGKPSNIYRAYYDTTISSPRVKEFLIKNFYKTEDSLIQEHRRILVWLEVIYDADGNEIITRDYTRQGQIQHESFYDHKRNFITSIYYHKNGRVESIGYTLNFDGYGHYQAYDENGLPLKSWDYDENGKQINIQMPKEMMERYLKMRGK